MTSESGHAPSWYAATAAPFTDYPDVSEPMSVDVAIIGGGFTGLFAALELAQRGRKPVVFEAERIGWGASGRNGGQLHSGQRRDVEWMEEHLGNSAAEQLWNMAEEAKDHIHRVIHTKHEAVCWKNGLIHSITKPANVDNEKRYIEKLSERYAYNAIDWLSPSGLQEALSTSFYAGGYRDRGAGHIHPLRLCKLTAETATRSGSFIFENSRIASIKLLTSCAKLDIKNKSGTVHEVRAKTVIIACNGYLDGLHPHAERHVLPIHNFIAVTSPVGAGESGGIMPFSDAASDSRFVVRYWRPTHDGRLLFGGGETYRKTFPPDIAAFVRPYLAEIYPQLADTPIDYAWGGTLAVTRERLPYLRRLAPNVYIAAGYSGHGVTIAPFAGKIIAEAICGDTERFDIFAKIPVSKFPGGRALRHPLMVLGMLWYALRDRL